MKISSSIFQLLTMILTGPDPSAAMMESLSQLEDGFFAGVPASDRPDFAEVTDVYMEDGHAFVLTRHNEVWIGAWMTPDFPGRASLSLICLPASTGKSPYTGEDLRYIISDPEIAIPIGSGNIVEIDWMALGNVTMAAANGLSVADQAVLHSFNGGFGTISDRVWGRLVPWMISEIAQDKIGLLYVEDQIRDAQDQAAFKIQRGCIPWLYKGITRDGRIGIHCRLHIAADMPEIPMS